MKNIEILAIKLQESFDNGGFVDDYETQGFFGEKIISLSSLTEELFGDPKVVIEEFERDFQGKCSDEMIDHLVKAGMETLYAYEMLLQQELNYVTPSMSQIVCAHMKGEINLDEINEKRKRITEKWFTVVMAMQQLGELQKDLKELGPRASKRLTNEWFGPLPK